MDSGINCYSHSFCRVVCQRGGKIEIAGASRRESRHWTCCVGSWGVIPETLKGTLFLMALVTCASMMPVEKLPAPGWQTALGLGFVSAIFDNIPLTALALKQAGYDWGFLAYAVGFGGSMIWFGSSAGVALANMYPEAKSVGLWLRHGWYIAVAYVIGFFVMLVLLGWHPDPDHRNRGRGGSALEIEAALKSSDR